MDTDEQIARQKFLINTAHLEKANYTTTARLFDDFVKILRQEFERDSLLLFVSNAAPYMAKAASAIKIFYTKMTHVTCLVHGFHRVFEHIQTLYPKIDNLISNIKKAFLKVLSRILIFWTLDPNLALPPQPITTRCRTWLNTVGYYTLNYEKIVNVIEAIDDEDIASV